MLRRSTTLLLLIAVAAVGSMSIAACGKTLHRAVSIGWCAYSVDRAYHDVKHHHLGWGAFQALMAEHHCKQVFHRP